MTTVWQDFIDLLALVFICAVLVYLPWIFQAAKTFN